MKRWKWMRHLAVLAAIGLFVAACGDDAAAPDDEDPVVEEDPADEEPADDPADDEEAVDDEEGPADDEEAVDDEEEAVDDEEEATEEDDEDVADEGEVIGGGEGLILGYILPESGPLAFLGPPQIESVRMAIEDINEAGGVADEEVTLITGDEAGDEAVARDTADRLINDGVHGIIGAAASGMSQAFIQTTFDNQIPQCSAANTSPAFSDQDNAGYYVRTVPPDEAVAPIIADEVIADGATSVSVLARADDYGSLLQELIIDSLEESGVEVVGDDTYDPNATTFDAEVGNTEAANPDAIVIIGFDEAGQVIAGLLEAGFTPDQMYGGDGMFGPTFNEQVDATDPNVIDGLKVIGAAGDAGFNDRLSEIVGGNLIYGGQAYDCAMIMALAAESAGWDDPDALIDAAKDVTRDGEPCASFEDCKALLEDGEDIDYDGASGPIELDDVGDPTFGRYAVGQFNDGELDIVGDYDVELAELE